MAITRLGGAEWAGLCISKRPDRLYFEDYGAMIMTVWNPNTGAPEYLSCTESDQTDATVAVLAAYNTYILRAQQEAAAAERERRAAAERVRVARGKTIRVVRGRKVPKGTEGECLWVGEGNWGYRVGLRTVDEEIFWTALENVEVVPPVVSGQEAA